jgi:hypothetical protein
MEGDSSKPGGGVGFVRLDSDGPLPSEIRGRGWAMRRMLFVLPRQA